MMVTRVVSLVMMLQTLHLSIIQVQHATKKIKSIVMTQKDAQTMPTVLSSIPWTGPMTLVSFRIFIRGNVAQNINFYFKRISSAVAHVKMWLTQATEFSKLNIVACI